MVDRGLAAVVPPAISGIEVTQAIQYYRSDQHLTDASQQRPDNSLPLVAYKPIWLRIYVSGGLTGRGHRFTASVSAERHEMVNPNTGVMKWTPVGLFRPATTLSLPESPGPYTPYSYFVERSYSPNTINVVLPADVAYGVLRLHVELSRMRLPIESLPVPPVLDVRDLLIEAGYAQHLRVRGIPVAYDGPALPGGVTTLPAPTLTDLIRMARTAHSVLPVSSAGSYSLAGGITISNTLVGSAESGFCSEPWQDLMEDLIEAADDDGNRDDVVYIGLIPSNLPSSDRGCEGGGVAGVLNYDGMAMAHEIAHAAGVLHAPCGVTGGVDPDYPTYAPYPDASIGEFGLDINNGAMYAPRWTFDLMSYCAGKWISPYTHERLFNNQLFSPVYVGPKVTGPGRGPIPHAPSWKVPRQRVIAVIGRVTDSGSVEVRSVRRVEAIPVVRRARRTGLVAQLLGAGGDVLVEAPVWSVTPHGCGCGGAEELRSQAAAFGRSFHGYLPDVARGSALRLVRIAEYAGEPPAPVWQVDAPPRAPRIGAIRVQRAPRRVTLTWNADAARPLVFSVQVPSGRGRSWDSVATGLSRPKLVLPIDRVPSGRVRFRVLAHDGFHSTAKVSPPLTIPERGPAVTITYPLADQPHPVTAPLRLCAVVHDQPADARVSWELNGARVGDRSDVWLPAIERSGRHTCRVTVRVGRRSVSSTVRFRSA